MSVKIFESIEELRAWRLGVKKLGFVATMGNLHAGHLSLIDTVKERAETVIVSIFVNPLQFGEGEDLSSYPRTLEEDIAKLEAYKVDALFLPREEILYPREQSFFVKVPDLAGQLCGKFRPGHFEGVATVVSKLFNIIEPDFASFGEKDYQQLQIIKAMVKDLNFNLKIISSPTIREEKGLALSSRNTYLSPAEKKKAVELYLALKKIADSKDKRLLNLKKLVSVAKEDLFKKSWKLDYIELRDADFLGEISDKTKKIVVLGAASLGKVRLIDNISFDYKGE